jgi:membrane-associated phospholipid phosphatase
MDSSAGYSIVVPVAFVVSLGPLRLRNSAELKPADKVIIAYLAIIASLILISNNRVQLWPLLVAAHSLAILIVVVIAKSDDDAPRQLHSKFALRHLLPSATEVTGRTTRFMHFWYPLVLVPLTYKELEYLIPRIHPRDFDRQLAAIDYRMFGVHPTVWLERITNPLLTEILQLSYTTYYFLPLVLGIVLWRNRWFEQFQFALFVLALGFYLSYLGYISVPAIGPRFLDEVVKQQTKPLNGLLLFEPIHATLNKLEGITRDCFPSGHTVVALLVLYCARRFHLRSFGWMLPLVSALIFSTVYLRYHYVIDVIAGALLAAVIIAVAEPLYRVMGGAKAPSL